MNSCQRGDDEPVGFLGADGHAQRIRQLVAADAAQDQSARGEERVGVRRGLAFVSGKWISRKLATLGVTFSPSLSNLLGQPGEPFFVVRARSF